MDFLNGLFGADDFEFTWGEFFQDAFQVVATYLGSIFQSETWTTVWQRFMDWFDWDWLVDRNDQVGAS